MYWINSGNIQLNSSKYISTPELVEKYSILIDIEGNGYSGRLKHYIPVKRDLTDLIEKTKWCLNNYDKALQIAENAYRFSKLHLTRDTCYNKWNDISLT
jgi:hypothetical protein